MLSVADALARVLAHAAPLPAEEVPLAEAARPRARRPISRRCAPSRRPTCPPWTAMRCAPPTWRTPPVRLKVIGEVAAGRPFARRDRARRGGAHLHRRRDAGRRRHRGDPGGDASRDGDRVEVAEAGGQRAAMSARKGSTSRPASAARRKGRRLTARDLALAAAMNHPTVPVHRRPQVAAVRHRRRTGAARQPPGAGPDRLIPTALRWRRSPAAKAPRSTTSASSRDRLDDDRRGRARARGKAARTSWSPPAAPRSATTISCSRRSPPKAWRCRSGRWRCGPAGR